MFYKSSLKWTSFWKFSNEDLVVVFTERLHFAKFSLTSISDNFHF